MRARRPGGRGKIAMVGKREGGGRERGGILMLGCESGSAEDGNTHE